MTFDRSKILYLLYSLLIFTIVGIHWWSLPYQELRMDNAFIQWSIFIVAISFSFKIIFKLNSQKIILSSVMGLLATVIVRIIHDIIQDPTTHGMFLIELLIATVVASSGSGAGVILFYIISNKKKKKEKLNKSEVDHQKKYKNRSD